MIPLVRLLNKNFPQATITWFIDPVYIPLMQNQATFTPIPLRRPRNLRDYWQAYKTLSKNSYDILFCTQHSLRVNLLYPFIKAKRKIGFDPIRGRDLHQWFIDESIPFRQEHQMEALASFAAYCNYPVPTPLTPDLYRLKDLNSLASSPEFKQPFLIIHPASSNPERNWDKDSYISLIQKLISASITVVITGADKDRSFCNQIEKEAPQLINLAGKLSLEQLAHLFQNPKLQLVVAPDTGPIHLANACGAKTLGLYAAVPSWYTGPYGQNCFDLYEEAVKIFAGGQPSKHVVRIHHPQLMSLFQVEKVIMKILKLITLSAFFLTLNISAAIKNNFNLLFSTSLENLSFKKVQLQRDENSGMKMAKKCLIDQDKITEKKILGPLFKEVQKSHYLSHDIQLLKSEIKKCAHYSLPSDVEKVGGYAHTRYIVALDDGQQLTLADAVFDAKGARQMSYYSDDCPQLKAIVGLLDDHCSF